MKTMMLTVTIGLLVLTHSAVAETEVGVSIGLRRQSPENLQAHAGHHHDHNNFHDALSPYGYWIEYPGLGKVWQPAASAADRNWRPYCNEGNWVWTDRGWYWESNYAWGWACFHYGRWLQTAYHNWVWVPGTVWAPAWVHWRQGHNHTYGWAPLPPNCGYTMGIGFHYPDSRISFRFGVELCDDWYVFVSYDNFFAPDIGRVCYSRTQCSTYYRSSTCYDYGYRQAGGTIYHAGPSPRLSYQASSRSSTVNRIVGNRLQRSSKPAYKPSSSTYHPQGRTYTPAPTRTYKKPPSGSSSSRTTTYKRPPSNASSSSSRTYKKPPSSSSSSSSSSRSYKKPSSSGSKSSSSKSSSSSGSSKSGGSRSSRINSRFRR